MAYSGPPNWDEFDNESIEAFWNVSPGGGAAATETADGYLTTTFISAPGTNQAVYMDQDSGDGFTPIPSGTPWEFNSRFYVPPIPYDTGTFDYGANNYDNEVGFRFYEWSLWDDVITYTFRISWNHGQTPWGQDMTGHESCYTVDIDMDDEGQSIAERFGPSWMTDRGVDNVVLIADENHSGWFTLKFSKDASGNHKFEMQPEGEDVIDITPLTITNPYLLNYGDKAGRGWGHNINFWEFQGSGYGGASPGPLYYDWVRETYEFSSGVSSGVSATLDGEAVEIAEQVIERYGNFVVYIDSSNILKIKDASITDFSTDVPIAVSASHL